MIDWKNVLKECFVEQNIKKDVKDEYEEDFEEIEEITEP